MVSPQNPLKPSAGMASSEKRTAHARALTAAYRRIVVRDDEIRENIFYTAQSIARLKARYRKTQFVWLMGADNLKQFHRWKRYQAIAHMVPFAVLDRAPYSFAALASKAARMFAKSRIPAKQVQHWAASNPPAWMYLCIPRHPLSATFLRKTLGENAFLGHNKAKP